MDIQACPNFSAYPYSQDLVEVKWASPEGLLASPALAENWNPPAYNQQKSECQICL